MGLARTHSAVGQRSTPRYTERLGQPRAGITSSRASNPALPAGTRAYNHVLPTGTRGSFIGRPGPRRTPAASSGAVNVSLKQPLARGGDGGGVDQVSGAERRRRGRGRPGERRREEETGAG